MAPSHSPACRSVDGGWPTRAVVAVALAVLLVAAGSAAAAGAATGLQDADDDGCPQHGNPKDGDVNGDGVPDWKAHEQEHDNGTVQLWCVDRDPDDDQPPHDEYFALVWIDESGDRHFVGKCPYDEGNNHPMKRVDDEGNLERVSWLSVDGGADDDGDGKTDAAVYRYAPGNDTLIVAHFEDNLEQDRENRTPPESPFDFDDLKPENTSTDDFFAVAERPAGEFGTAAMTVAADRQNLTVAVREVATGEPLGGASVTIRTTDGEAVETLATSAVGEATTALPAGRYVLDVARAPPRTVDLRLFSLEVAVAASPDDGGDSVARLEDRVARLEDRVARLEDRVADLRSRNDALRSDVRKLRNESDALRTEVTDLERDDERLRENVSALRSEVAALREPSSGGTVPGLGTPVALVAVAVAAALVRRRSPGRGGR